MAISERIAARLRRFLRIEPPDERTVVIKEPFTHEGNCAKNRIWYRGIPQQLADFYRQTDDGTMFWAARQTRGLEIRKIHTGLPGIVIDTVTQIICNDFNGIEIDGEGREGYTQLWEAVSTENHFEELLETAVRECAIVGDGAWKISFDPEISGTAILEFFPAERVEFVRRRGRIVEVRFYTDIVQKDKRYRFVESYGYGFIRYRLENEDGRELPLDTLEQTAWAEGSHVSFDKSLIWAVPMLYGKSALFEGRGKSLIETKDCAGDALDEALSQWMDALRASRTKTYIPETLVPRDPETLLPVKPNAFDSRFIVTGADVSENANNKVMTETPEIRHDAYLQTYITALGEYLQGLISPSTIGIDVKKLDNAEAQREKEKTTLYTRQNFVEMVQKVLPQLVRCTLNAVLSVQGQPIISAADFKVKANFGEYANPSFESQVETVGKAKTNGVMSVEQAVEELYGDSKSEDWKKEEVARIKQESGMVEMPQPYEKDDIDLSEV